MHSSKKTSKTTSKTSNGGIVTGKTLLTAYINAKTPSEKGRYTRMLNSYVSQRVAEGKSEESVRAGIKSYITRHSKSA